MERTFQEMVDANKMTVISDLLDQLEIYDQKRNALLLNMAMRIMNKEVHLLTCCLSRNVYYGKQG